MTNEQLDKFLSTATPYHFTIHNECNELATATINLESLNAGEEKQLEDQYINAILYETDYHNNLNSVKQLIASIYNDENKVLEDSLHAYKLYNFTLQKGETKSFNLQLYMDSNTPMEDVNMNASWKGKITLSAEYKEEIQIKELGKDIKSVESGDGLYAVPHDDLEELGQEWNKTEYRYAGEDPDNYVKFNNEIWRIIGLVNVKIENEIEQRIKIVRQDGVKDQKTFGNYAWDYIQYQNGCDGTNDWINSKLKNILNGIYYESGSGDCYIGTNDDVIKNTCDFSSGTELPHGLDTTARSMIDKDAIWNIGAINNEEILAHESYEKEHGTSTGYRDDNIYSSEWSNETDIIEHNGIGLIYPSDYGYAVGGDERNNCLTKNLESYNEENCYNSDWLTPSSGALWTMTPNINEPTLGYVCNIYTSGFVADQNSYFAYNVWPVVYLTPSTKIIGGDGTIDKPYRLQIVS